MPVLLAADRERLMATVGPLPAPRGWRADHAWTQSQRTILDRVGPDAPAMLDRWVTSLSTRDHIPDTREPDTAVPPARELQRMSQCR